MKVVEIQKRKDEKNLSYDFKITYFGLFSIYCSLTHEQVVVCNKYPLWFRFSKWIFNLTCRHQWKREWESDYEICRRCYRCEARKVYYKSQLN